MTRFRINVLPSSMGAIVLLFCGNGVLAQPAPTVPLGPERIQRLEDQPIGDHTLEAFNLPHSFLTRVGHRMTRLAYQQRYQRMTADAIQVAQDEKSPGPPSEPSANARDMSAGESFGGMAVILGVLGLALALLLVVAKWLRSGRQRG